MSRICYVNGRYVQAAAAQVSMWDRGYQLSDGVYEVIVFFNREFLDEDRHIERLKRSLEILRIPMPMSDQALRMRMRDLIRRNSYDNGSIYLQITRGVAKRGHPFPNPEVRPSLTMSVFGAKQPVKEAVEKGIRVVTTEDIRWKHCDIKSISLLPNVLANQYAIEQGCKEVIMINREGYVTEGSHSNAYIVTYDGVLVTHPADEHILNGVRRQNVMWIAKELRIPVEERLFTAEELLGAREAFLTSANTNILPVTTIDDSSVGNGQVGEVTNQIAARYREHVTAQTGKTWE